MLFEFSLGDYVEFTVGPSNFFRGTIVGTDFDYDYDQWHYLIMMDEENDYNGTLSYALEVLESVEFLRLADNLPEDKYYVWIEVEFVKCLVEKEETVKEEVTKGDDSGGRWLSGIDQYSENNYNRGNSGFKWL